MQELGHNSLRVNSLEEFKVISRHTSLRYGLISFVLHIPTREFMILKSRIQQEDKPTAASVESAVFIKVGPHPHICKFYGFVMFDRRMILSVKYYPLGTLQDQIKRYREINYRFEAFQIWYLLLHISKALLHIHSKGYIMTNIKPENITLNEEVYSDTYGCNIRYVDEDSFSRDSNVLFIIGDFANARDCLCTEPQNHKEQQYHAHRQYSFASKEDKFNEIYNLKTMVDQINSNTFIKHNRPITPSELLAMQPKSQFTKKEVIDFEMSKCGVFEEFQKYQTQGVKETFKSDVYDLAILAIEMYYLKSFKSVSDEEFQEMDRPLQQFLTRMLSPENERPSMREIHEKCINILQCAGRLIQDAVKNQDELLQERMQFINDTSTQEEYVRPSAARTSSSRPVSGVSTLQRVSLSRRSYSFKDTIKSIAAQREEEPNIIGKQGVPSPVQEKLLRSTLFEKKFSKDRWEWDSVKENVPDYKQQFYEGSTLGDFGLTSEIAREQICRKRTQSVNRLLMGNRKTVLIDKGFRPVQDKEFQPVQDVAHQPAQDRAPLQYKAANYVNVRGGGAVCQRRVPRPATEFEYVNSSPQYHSVFHRNK